jgi:hypothetical protein
MKRTQTLSSGLIVQQDFRDSIRPVFFETDVEEFMYATHGGTLFIVNFGGRAYGLTCGHVFQDFEVARLFIAGEKQAKKGSTPARVKSLCHASSPRDGAVGTDIVDICVVEFVDDITPEFFGGSAYIVDEKTVATSQVGHELHVAGVLKDKTLIVPPHLSFGYCRLQLHDVGVSTSDPVLRQAYAEFRKPEFESITGISGSPVFDYTANALCGMVVRGGMSGIQCRLHYIDIFDIVRFPEAASRGVASAYYTKSVVQIAPRK